jgi:hypothetical protein
MMYANFVEMVESINLRVAWHVKIRMDDQKLSRTWFVNRFAAFGITATVK